MRARGRRPWPVCRPGRSARAGSPAIALVLVLALAACNGATVAPSGPGSPTSSLLAPSGSPSESASEVPSDEPSSEPSEAPSGEPSSSAEPGNPSASPGAGGTDACLGSSDTRDFFASFAQAVTWPVYCATLPKGWSVEKGTYRLKNGGRLTISYKRRVDGARLVLDEGAVCAETKPCVPVGSDIGTTPFGDRVADLSSVDAGGYAAVVDGTENPAWLLTGTGLTRSDFAEAAADLHLLND